MDEDEEDIHTEGRASAQLCRIGHPRHSCGCVVLWCHCVIVWCCGFIV